MDKQGYRDFLNEIKRGYDSGNYERVASFADEIDFNKIKDRKVLEMISDSYVRLGKYDQAREALLAVYQKNVSGRQLLYRLCELSIAVDDLDSAVDFYNEFCEAAHGDSKRFILKYEIGRAGGVHKSDLIKVLEAYTAREKDERWQYELAKLYHETGQDSKCDAVVDDMFLWYADGDYVKKALELKFSHTALTKEQQARYEEMMGVYSGRSQRKTFVDDAASDEITTTVYKAEENPEELEKTQVVVRPGKGSEPSVEETRVIPLSQLIDEFQEEEFHEEEQEKNQPAAEEEHAAGPDEEKQEYSTMSMDELREMIRDGNKAKAQAGVFFKMEEVTAEDIEKEADMKAARDVERSLARQEQQGEAEAESRRLEAEQAAWLAAQVAAVPDEQEDYEDTDEEEYEPEQEEAAPALAAQTCAGETVVISRAELFERLSALEKTNMPRVSVRESRTYDKADTGTETAEICAEQSVTEDTCAGSGVAAETSEAYAGYAMAAGMAAAGMAQETVYSQEKTVTGPETETDLQQECDAAGEVQPAADEIQYVSLTAANAGKLGTQYAYISPRAAEVKIPWLRPCLYNPSAMTLSADSSEHKQTPRLIENANISYMALTHDESGQLGIDINDLVEDDDTIEGQMSFFEVKPSRKISEVPGTLQMSEVERQRLREIQQAAHIDAPVVLPYDMADPYFDDIEIVETEEIMLEEPLTTEVPEADTELSEADEVSAEAEPSEADEVSSEAEASETEEVSVENETSEADKVSAETEPSEADEVSAETETSEADEVSAEAETSEADEVSAETETSETEEVSAEVKAPDDTETSEEADSIGESAAPEDDADALGSSKEEAEDENGAESVFEAAACATATAAAAVTGALTGCTAEEQPESEANAEPDRENADETVDDDMETTDAEAADEGDQAEDEAGEADDAAEADTVQMSEADLAIARFEEEHSQISEEVDIDTEAFDEFGDSLASLISSVEPDGDYAEYDNEEEVTPEAFVPDAAEADKAASSEGSRLSEETREVVHDFLLIDGMEEQIADAIEEVTKIKKSGDSTGGNLIVTGDTKTGKSYLIAAIMSAVARNTGTQKNIAKIRAEHLNEKVFSKVANQIRGFDLLVEDVGNLEDRTITGLIKMLSGGTFDGVTILEGNQLAMDNIFRNFPELSRYFRSRVDINELSIVQWADMGIKYAEEKGYVVDDMAKLALHAKINEINLPTVHLGYSDITDILDKAMERADKRNVGRLFAAFSRKEHDTKKEIKEQDISR